MGADDASSLLTEEEEMMEDLISAEDCGKGTSKEEDVTDIDRNASKERKKFNMVV